MPRPFTAALLMTALLAASAQTPPPPEAKPASQPARKPANDPTPTLITLHDKDAPPPAVVQDFFAQIGAPYTLTPANTANWKPISLDLDNEPFWSALAKLETALPGTISFNGTRFTANHVNGAVPAQAGLRIISGPCLLVARDIRNTITLTDPDHPRDCALAVTVYFEPRLKIVGFATRTPPDVALDEHNKSLLGSPPPAVMRITPNANNNPLSLEIPFQPPSDAGYKIAQLKGSLHFLLLDEVKNLDIAAADFAAPHTMDLHGAIMQVQPISVSRTNNIDISEARVTLTLERNALSDDAWTHVSQLFDAIEPALQDAKGVPFQSNSYGSSSSANQRQRLFNFAPVHTTGPSPTPPTTSGPPAHCRIAIPFSFHDLSLPYDLKSLPLP